MKRLNKALCAGMLCAIVGMSAVAATTAQAEGFALYEWSARGNALGGAVVARADDPSAIAFNPAGITQLPGAQVQVGMSFITPDLDIKTDGMGTESNKSAMFYIPNGYYTQQLNDNWWIGLGMYSRFGMGIGYDNDWVGKASIIEANLETFSVSPVLAYKVSDKLSFAFGFEVMYAYLDMTKNLGKGDTSELYAEADSMGIGAIAAVHFKPADDWSIGLSYKSQVKQKLRGDADIYGGTTANTIAGITGFSSSAARGDVVLPDEVLFGVAYQATDKLSIEVGAVWTNWSTYKQLSIHMDDFANHPVTKPSLGNPITKKDWKNTMRYNLGVEYQALDWLDLRFGYAYDESPVPSTTADYMIPTNDRHLFSTGAGFRIDDWTIDASYTFILATDRDFDGNDELDYPKGHSANAQTHVFGLSVGYTF